MYTTNRDIPALSIIRHMWKRKFLTGGLCAFFALFLFTGCGNGQALAENALASENAAAPQTVSQSAADAETELSETELPVPPEQTNNSERAGQTDNSTSSEQEQNSTSSKQESNSSPSEQTDNSAPPDQTNTPSPPEAPPDAFVFTYGGVDIYFKEPIARVLSKLGPENEYYEYESCLFDGNEKIYVYDGFQMSTYIEDADIDRVYSVTLSVGTKTPEGVQIGDTRDNIVKAYGDGYEEIPGSLIYERGGVLLSFNVEDEIITSISYYVNDIYE